MSEVQSCRCACGGLITANVGQEQKAVEGHNATPGHRRWRVRGGCWQRMVNVDAVERANAASAARWGCAA